MDDMVINGNSLIQKSRLKKKLYVKYLDYVGSDVSIIWLIMNYTKIDRIVINNKEISYAKAVSR